MTLHTVRPMPAEAGYYPVPTAKRCVNHAKTQPVICHKQWELDIRARLEKRTLKLTIESDSQ